MDHCGARFAGGFRRASAFSRESSLPWAAMVSALMVFRPDIVEGTAIFGTLMMMAAPEPFWAAMSYCFPSSPRMQAFKVKWGLIAPKRSAAADAD